MRSRQIVFGLGVTAALALSPAANAGAILGNQVTNGNFATGDFTGWNVQQDQTQVNSVAVVIKTDGVARPYPDGAFDQGVSNDPLTTGSSQASAGYGAYFSTDTGTQSFTQALNLTAGTYSIGFDMYVPLNGYLNPYDSIFSANVIGTSLYSQQSVDNLVHQYGTNTWVTVDNVATIQKAGNYNIVFSFTGMGKGGGTANDIIVNRVFVSPGNVNSNSLTSVGGGSGTSTPVSSGGGTTSGGGSVGGFLGGGSGISGGSGGSSGTSSGGVSATNSGGGSASGSSPTLIASNPISSSGSAGGNGSGSSLAYQGPPAQPQTLPNYNAVLKVITVPRDGCTFLATQRVDMPVSVNGSQFYPAGMSSVEASTYCKDSGNVIAYLKSAG